MAARPRRVTLESRKMPVGLERSATRTLLLDTAERLMRDEGYAAVTTRRLGDAAAVKPQLVHYYFPSMDDLFTALFRRRAEQGLESARQALDSDRPLRVLWQRSRDPSDAAVRAEFMALAHHRKELKAEMAAFIDQIRRLQHQALVRHFAARGVTPKIDPAVITLLIGSLAMMIAREEELGVTFGHAQTETLVETALAQFEARLAGEPEPPRHD
jgi:AcrR family transcriptional regulator